MFSHSHSVCDAAVAGEGIVEMHEEAAEDEDDSDGVYDGKV